MNRNNHYWEGKENRAEKARSHVKLMEESYPFKIDFSIRHSRIYDDTSYLQSTDDNYPIVTEIYTDPIDTVSAIFKYENMYSREKMAVLNFASYKNPGGKFLQGSKAQEECLCHESTLYNVLKEFDYSYYSYNRNNLNKALYTNRALYSPKIIFSRDKRKTYVDVITCAAPNWTAASKYNNVTKDENFESLKSRLKFVLDVAEHNRVDILILGAFGCGVFGQDPYTVGDILWCLLCLNCYSFKKIVFAIPPSVCNDNLKAFRYWFGKERKDSLGCANETQILMAPKIGLLKKIK